MKVSIITPSYNQGKFIERTILSVLNQSYRNIEYIVIDGGSTDSTMEVVEKYEDRIDKIVHENDKGQADAINKGFKMASGELVGWINSDDVLYPHCVERIVELANKNPDGSIYYSSKIDLIDKHDNIIEQRERMISDKDNLLNENYDIIQQASFYKLNAVKEVGFLNDDIHYCMDLDLWLRLLDRGQIYSFNADPLGAFRIWEETKTTNGEIFFLKDIKRTLDNHGMRMLSSNNNRLHWYMLKKRIKSLIRQ